MARRKWTDAEIQKYIDEQTPFGKLRIVGLIERVNGDVERA